MALDSTPFASLLEELPRWLASLALWATVLLGLAWLLTGQARNSSAAVRYCCWQVAILGLLALPILTAALPGVPLGLLYESASLSAASRVTSAATEPPQPPTIEPRPLVVERAVETPVLNVAPIQRAAAPGPAPRGAVAAEKRVLSEPAVNRASLAVWFAIAAWAVGVAAQLGWLAWRVRCANRLASEARLLASARFEDMRRDVSCRLGLRGPVRLLISPTFSVPLVVGVHRPRIVLPASCETWSAERLRIVLAHELAHVERRDVPWQLLARIVAAFYWPHPLVWLAVRQMRRERERACDDRVLALGVSSVDYAAGLVDVAAALAGRSALWIGGIGMAERGPLEERVRSILDDDAPRQPASQRLRRALVLATACLVLGLAVLRPFSPIPTSTATAASPDDLPSPPALTQTQPAQATEPPVIDVPKQAPTKGNMLVHCLDPEGRPLPGVRLHASVRHWNGKRDEIKNQDLATGSDGTARLALPEMIVDIRLWATAQGNYIPLYAGWWPEEQADGHLIPEEFTYRFRQGTTLGGIVKNDDGQPIKGVKVEMRYDGRQGEERSFSERPVVNSWLAEDESAVVTDVQGRWRLDNVPPGDDIIVRIKLSHSDYIDDSDWGDSQLKQGVTVAELRAQAAEIILHRGFSLTGRVTDPAGNPVEKAVVVWGDRPYWDEGFQEVKTDEQGAYRFPPLPAGPLPVTVIAEGWMPQRTNVTLTPDMQPFDFQLQPGKLLRLRFVDGAGEPLPEVLVGIKSWRGHESLYNMQHPNITGSAIPRVADAQGVFEWTWAPDDAVEYWFSTPGYAEGTASIKADGSEQVQVLHPRLRLAGTLADAETGRPIEQFTAAPMIHFRRDFPLVERINAEPQTGGRFDVKFDRTDGEHGLQLESPGYTTLRLGPYRVGQQVEEFKLRMAPCPRYLGRVIDESGQPVAAARVYVSSYSQHLYISELSPAPGHDEPNYVVTTDADGKFEIVPQLERYRVTVIAETGFGDADLRADQPPGEIRARRWAKVKGRLWQSGQPVARAQIAFGLLREDGGDAPRGNMGLWAATAPDGSFEFARVPPGLGRVHAYLHWSRESPLSSSRSVPLDLSPGQEVDLSLGRGGAEITGHFVLEPNSGADFDYHYALNYLLARRVGVEAPGVNPDGFDWRKGWNHAWTASQEGFAYVNTLHHFFVKPDPDGSFRISGVEPGDYELAWKIHASTEGCLVHPLSMGVLRFTVPDGQTSLDLGRVTAKSLPVLNEGDVVPDFEFVDADGTKSKLSNLRGKPVLPDFWATWCAPCVAKLDEVEQARRKFSERKGLVVVGVNLDDDPSRVQALLQERKLPWRHALLGHWAATDVPRQYGISAVPTYLLIAADGRMIARGHALEPIVERLNDLDETISERR